MKNVKEINKNQESFHELDTKTKHILYADLMRGDKDPLLFQYSDCKELIHEPFPRIAVMIGKDSNGVPVYINSQNEVYVKSIAWLESTLYQYLDKLKNRSLRLSNKDIKEVVQYYLKKPNEINNYEIKSICQLSEDKQVCWKRLLFDFDNDIGDTPMFDELMGRWENSQELMRYLGMVFYSNIHLDAQKYIWIYGHEGTGKGCLFRFLKTWLGQSSGVMTPRSFNSKHGLSSVVSVRLLQFDDAVDDKFIKNETFLSLTGGGEIRVEEKYQKPYSVEMHALPVIYSNAKPEISEGQDTRRLIFIKSKAPEKDFGSSYEIDLLSEGPSWIKKCVHLFLERPKFPQYDFYSKQLFSENNSWIDSIIDKELIFTSNSDDMVQKAQITSFLRNDYFKNPKEIKLFFRHFEREYHRPYLDTTRQKVKLRGYDRVKPRVLKNY